MERNPQRLEDLYRQGYRDAQASIDKINCYLDGKWRA